MKLNLNIYIAITIIGKSLITFFDALAYSYHPLMKLLK